MNETLSVFLDFKPEDYGIEKIIERMDQLMEENGWIYTGLSNMYRPVDGLTRDETIYKVMHTLDHTEWLKPYHPRILIGNLVDAMKLSNIDVSGMRAPSKRKLERYEEYYNLTKSLPHSIIVDEKGRIRDGYITYLLAWKYSEKPKILSTWRNRPLKKLVIGKHVYWDKEHASEKAKSPIAGSMI